MTNKILIVDDDPQFLRTMADGLNEHDNMETITCEASSFEDLRKNIPEEGFELLWDFGLPVDWLRELQNIPNIEDRIRTWIVTGASDANVAALRDMVPQLKIQTRQFDKTQNVVEQFVGEIKKEESETDTFKYNPSDAVSLFLKTLRDWFNNYPDYLRIVDQQRKVVWTNSKWKAHPYIPSVEEVDLDLINNETKENAKEWNEAYRWGLLPGVEESSTDLLVRTSGYYLLRQRLIKIRNKPKLVQLLIPQPDLPARNLGEAIDQILKEMIARSFKRARFFRIRYFPDGNEGVLSLEAQQGGIAADIKLPHSRPIKGRRVDDIQSYYSKREYPPDELPSRVQKTDDKNPDASWVYWDKIVGIKGMKEWLEVAILDPVSDNGKETKNRILGMLICDCKDELDGKIPEQAIKWSQNKLLRAVQDLCRLIKNEEHEQRLKARKAVQEEWGPLLNANGVEALEQAILDAACRLTDVDEGILFIKLPDIRGGLEVRARRGKIQEQFRAVISLDEAKSLPTVQALKQRKIIVEPWFMGSGLQNDLLRDKAYEVLAEKNHESKIEDWLRKGIGSLVSGPLLRGERVIGALSLQHKEEMHINPDRVARLQALLDVAAPLLEAEYQQEDRRLWLNEVIHRIGSRVNAVHGMLDTAINQLDPDRGDTLLRQANEQAAMLRRLMIEIRDSDHAWNMDGSFLLDWPNRLEKAKKRMPERLGGECNRRITDKSQWSTKLMLRGDDEALDLILLNLLINACKYAEGQGDIEIQADRDDRYWILRISNPGSIPKGWDETIFAIDRRGPNANGEGLGMGLTNSRRAARMHDGDLVLENHGRRRNSREVTFRLEWPVSEQHTEETL